MNEDLNRDNFENSEDYVEKLVKIAKKNPMALNRRQLQDVGLYYFQEAMDEESFEAMFEGIKHYDMAMNLVDSHARSGKALGITMAQVLPDEEEAKEIDKRLEAIEEKHSREAQTMQDRIEQKMKEKGEDEEGENSDE